MSLDELLLESLAAKIADRLAAKLQPISDRLDGIERRLPTQLVSVERAAEHLGLCPTTIQRLCRRGKLPATRRGRKWLVDLAKVRAVDDVDVEAAAAEARG